jgi:hypothetical protein
LANGHIGGSARGLTGGHTGHSAGVARLNGGRSHVAGLRGRHGRFARGYGYGGWDDSCWLYDHTYTYPYCD